jgi:hypothetical protein
MNSVGVLPLELLDAVPKYKYQAACNNLKQMVEQYSIKREERRQTSIFFKDYEAFGPSALKRVDTEVHRLIDSMRFEAAANLCLEWVNLRLS